MEKKQDSSSPIEQLENQGHLYYLIHRYARAEESFARALEQIGSSDDWASRIRLSFWLATARQLQGKSADAWDLLVPLAEQLDQLTVQATLADPQNVALHYQIRLLFVEVGRGLLRTPRARLHEMCEQAERLLREFNHPEWAHAIELQRGLILQQEGRLAEARTALETALALRRQDSAASPGFLLENHWLELGHVLEALHEDQAAERCYQEVLASGPGNASYSFATAALAGMALRGGRWNEALRLAREDLEPAVPAPDPGPRIETRLVLVSALIVGGRLESAGHEAVRLWTAGRQVGTPEVAYRIARQFAQIRLAYARRRAGLPIDPAIPLPDRNRTPRYTPQTRQQIERYLTAAECWLDYARKPASFLDDYSSLEIRRTELRRLADQITGFRSWLDELPTR